MLREKILTKTFLIRGKDNFSRITSKAKKWHHLISQNASLTQSHCIWFQFIPAGECLIPFFSGNGFLLQADLSPLTRSVP